jgi:hypothetical protein
MPGKHRISIKYIAAEEGTMRKLHPRDGSL